ncbi:MAG: type I pullulanase [Elusimicrobiales bacterium]|jgi:pullulanase
MTVNLYAQSETIVHYNRLKGDYNGWNLWVWDAGEKKEGFEAVPAGTDGYGAVFRIDLKLRNLVGHAVGLIPRYKNWEARDGVDRVYKKAVPGGIFLVEGDPAVYTAAPEISTRIVSALLESENGIKVVFNRPVDLPYVSKQGFYATNGEDTFHPLKAAFPDNAAYGRAAFLMFDSLGKIDYKALNSGRWQVHSRDLKPAALGLGGAVYGDYFKSDKEMGLRVRDGKTYIRVFAPTASKVEALFYSAPAGGSEGGKRAAGGQKGGVSGTPPRQHPELYALEWKENGLWETEIPSDLTGRYWKLRTAQNGRSYEGTDPYAASVAAHDGPAFAVSDASPVAPGPVFGLSETVLYELHIRDFSIDGFSGMEHKGKYLAFTETGTVHPEYRDIKTGIDHLSELGVNAVHLLPFQDFENDESSSSYNWGYMPVNFNSPEGWYATGLYGGERVREAKAMIDALHKKGIKVVMDVVYNHTAETGGKVFNFDALAKDYYYRVREDGTRWNGSGCGNEFKSESPMGRKFIIDSLLHWVNEYKVDGFRFDLMGLIDQETAFAMVKRLKEAKPDILVYGEPWASGDTPVRGVRKGTQRSKGFAVFNDGLRDALKGSVFKAAEPGFVQAAANREAVMRGIKGAIDEFADSPLETLNYVSCHDNHTLWDRLALSAGDETRENRVRMDKLAQAVVLTSQGIPFLHAGEEFLRTKKGEENSYDRPDEINRLDWTLKKSNNGVFAFYRDLIALRKAHPAFRLKTAREVRDGLKFYEDLGLPVSTPEIAYVLNGALAGDSWNRIVVLINPRKDARKFALPLGEYEKALDENGACAGGRKFSGFAEVPPLSMMVLHD